MPFIPFDYRCETCGHEEERLVLKKDKDSQRCKQLVCETHECKGQMKRMPAGPKTTFKFADKSGLKS